MSSNNAPTRAAAVPSESGEAPLGSIVIYAVLARGFSQPDASVVEFFVECDKTEIKDDSEVSRCLAELLTSARAATLEELQSAYIRLFDPVGGPFPYEAESSRGDEFAKVQTLADINGFYRAFGVRPSNDRPDHIAAELEFMHLLALKESHAASLGQADNAAVCRDARVKFFNEHLARWTDSLLEMMRARSGENQHPFYENLMKLLQLFIESEKESLA